jgi:hypothetical protein
MGVVMDEQRVRTEAGWIGVEISKSRVRTPGKAGYGLYRVRGSAGRTWRETRELERSAVTEDLHGERGPWTAYAFTLEEILTEVHVAISAGRPDGPSALILRPADKTLCELVTVPTRWTSAYRGSRTRGSSSASVGADVRAEVPDIISESFTPPSVGTEVRYDPYGITRNDGGQETPPRETVRQRRRAANAEFQRQHDIDRRRGLVQRHQSKLDRMRGTGGSC